MSGRKNYEKYAVVEIGGKQLFLEEDKYYDVNLLNANVDDTIVLDRVLLLRTEENKIYLGQPCLSSTSVRATVLRHHSSRKIIVYKMRPKKKTRLKKGHRQKLTRIRIDSIEKV